MLPAFGIGEAELLILASTAGLISLAVAFVISRRRK